jgi:hypothetical protein
MLANRQMTEAAMSMALYRYVSVRRGGPPPSESIQLQTRTIIRVILAGIPSSGYTDRGQIPSKHLAGGSNPSRGTTQLLGPSPTRLGRTSMPSSGQLHMVYIVVGICC